MSEKENKVFERDTPTYMIVEDINKEELFKFDLIISSKEIHEGGYGTIDFISPCYSEEFFKWLNNTNFNYYVYFLKREIPARNSNREDYIYTNILGKIKDITLEKDYSCSNHNMGNHKITIRYKC